MKTNDFSVPRRMSKSALVIFWVRGLSELANVFLALVVVRIFNAFEENSLWKTVWMILVLLGLCLLVSVVWAFLNYYFRKYYVEEGNLIFLHGVFRKERTSIPLDKIQSLRTKRGFMYRLFDMTGVSFDTLASKAKEIELILDDRDWNELLNRMEVQQKDREEVAEAETPVLEEVSATASGRCDLSLKVSNLNLLKGALCQNHLKGMVILLGILGTLYDQFTSVNEQAAKYVIDYVDEQASATSFSLSAVLAVIVGLYVVVLVLWTGKIFLRYSNMNIQINDRQLFFESGLISRNNSRFSYCKICTVYIKRNFLEQWMNGCTIMLKQALNATDEKLGADVKIYGSNYGENFLNWWLGKDYTSSEEIISARSGYGLLGYVLRFDLLFVLLAGGVLWYYELYAWLALPFVYLLIALAKGLFAVRRSRITLRQDYLEVCNGKFAEIRNYFKYSNVEVVRKVSTPFTPYFHRVSLFISTNGTSFVVRSLKEEEADEIYEWLLYHCYTCK